MGDFLNTIPFMPAKIDATSLAGWDADKFLNQPGEGIPQAPAAVFPSSLIAKEVDPDSADYPNGLTTVLTVDAGTISQIIPTRLNLPARLVADCYIQAVVTMYNGSTVTIDNNTAGAVELTMQQLVDELTGVSGSAVNDGTSVQKIVFQVNNDSGTGQTGDFGVLGVRGFYTVKGV